MAEDAKKPGSPRRRATLSIKGVANWIGVSENTVRKLVREGKLARPRKLTDGSYRWFQADVRVFLYRLDRREFDDDTEKPPAKDRK